MHKTLFCAISFLMCPACGDSDGNTTAVITTIITGNPSATEADETTGSEGPTSTTEAATETSTTDVEPVTTTLESTTSTTTGEPWGCFNEGTECPPPPKAASFCEYVAESCASHGIEPFYCDIVNGMCDESRMVDECQVCFGLANYCAQIGTDCEGLQTECLCAYEAFEGGE